MGRSARSTGGNERKREIAAMSPRGNGILVLMVAAVLGLSLLPASWSSAGPDPQGNGYLTATFYVA